MKILFTICGRAGSKGIKNKNLRKFCGKYLIYYTISAIDLYLNRHEEVEADIVVNSDSSDLLDIVSENKMREIQKIERDISLSGDDVSKVAVIYDCLAKMQKRNKTIYDMIVDLDITSPLRTVQDLENVINIQLVKKPDVTTTVTTARRNPYFNQVKKVEYGIKKVFDSDYTARQQAPEIFDMNASIYAYSPEFLFSGNGVLDGYCEMVEMYDTGVLDLDHENDFELMEIIAKYLFTTKKGFYEIFENIK